MDHAPSHSALNTAAAALRGIWAAVLCGFGLFRVARPEPYGRPEPGEQEIADWVGGILRQLETMLAQFQAGELRSCDDAQAELPPRRGIVRAVRREVGADGPVVQAADLVDADIACDVSARVSNALRIAAAVATDIAALRMFDGVESVFSKNECVGSRFLAR